MTSRRANAEGSIYQRRGDLRWVGAVTTGYVDGKPQRKAVYGRTRAEVGERIVRLQSAAQLGMPMPNDKITVARFLADWLEGTVKPSVRASTYTGYEVLVRKHLTPALGHVRLSKLTPQQVEKLQAEKRAAKCSPRTVQYMRAVLRAALSKAVAWGYVGRNVAALASPPQVRRHEIRPLDAEQVQAFLTGVQEDRLEALYVVAFTMGLRQGEILGLRWADVDLEKSELRVVQTLTRGKGARFGEPKSERSRRTLHMPDITGAALRSHRTRQKEERLRVGQEWQDHGLIFVGRFGRPLDGCNLTRDFQAHLQRLGLPRQRFHDARHACASLLLSMNVPARVVMEILGHSQISLTMNTYSHVVPALQKEAAQQMDRLLAVGK